MTSEKAQEILIQTIENYEKIGKEFVLSRADVWQIFDYFRKFLRSGDKVLDAGCGNGRLIDILADFDVEYTGIDAAAAQLNFLRANYAPKLRMPPELIQTSLTELGMLKSGFYDIVFCVAALHHIPSRELRQRVINEFYRILRPGGKLVMTNWNLWSRWATKKYWPEVFRLIFPHTNMDRGDFLIPWKIRTGEIVYRYYHAFSRQELARGLESSGFALQENRYVNNDVGSGSNMLSGQNILTIALKRFH